MSPLNNKLIEEIQNSPLVSALIDLTQEYSRDYEFPRQNLLREIRRNDLYYMGIQDIWISDNANDWRNFTDIGSLGEDPSNANLNADFNFKFINIYRAYADSLIAALGVQVPATRFLPEDADNIDDVLTADAYGKIASLIRKNNKAKLLLIKTLAILYNHGCVVLYNYCDRDSKYGQVSKPERGVLNRAQVDEICSVCGNIISSEVLPAEIVEDIEALENQPEPEVDGNKTLFCPNCNNTVQPLTEVKNNLKEGIVDFTQINKIQEKIKAYGLSHAAFPPYVTSQEQIPIFHLAEEQDTSLVEEIYPHLKGLIPETNTDTPELNKWARQNYLYYGELPKHTCTVNEYWIRPWAFNRIVDDSYIVEFLQKENIIPSDIISPDVIDNPDVDNSVDGVLPDNSSDTENINRLSEYLKEKYPTGLRLVLIGEDLYAEHHEENLDDHITISICPTQEWLVAKSTGSEMIPIQDIKNDLVNLKLDTVEHGITENFIDQNIIDWNRYSKVEQRPGNAFPVNSSPNSALSNSFHQTKPASLSQEVEKFDESIMKDGQQVSGALPSLWGGNMDSDTAAEYSMSRTQALQRLLNVWAAICVLFSEMECKAVKDYAKNLNYDERYTTKNGSSAKNVWIKQIELKGAIAEIEAEASETMPLTWGQKNDLIFKLMGLNNEKVNEILGHPENIGKVATYVGSDELYIPGDDQRNKQLAETNEMINSIAQLGQVSPEAIQMMMQSGQPTVQIEPDVDDHEIHSEVCKAFLVSMEGQALKRDNPEAYLNILLHKKQHDAILAMQMKEMLAQEAKLNGDEQKDKNHVESPTIN